MAKVLAIRQLTNSTLDTIGPTAYMTSLSASGSATQAQFPSPAISIADVSTSSQESTTAVSLTETVILIAPSGTVGGSIIITSIPISIQSFPTSTLPEPSITNSGSFGVSSPSSANIVAVTSTNSLSPTIISSSSTPPARDLASSSQFSSLGIVVSRAASSSYSSTTSTSDISSTYSSSSSLSLSSFSSSTERSSSSSTLTPSLSSNTISQLSATSAPADLKQTKPLSTGGMAAVGVSTIGAALIVGLLFLFLCHRRRQRRRRVPSVYPEEAFLYDPPMIPSDRGPMHVETTEYRRAGEVGSVYGVHGESLVGAGLARPRTPDATVNERDSLLSRMRQGGRPRTMSSSLMDQSPPRLDTTTRSMNPSNFGGGYMPTPTEDYEIAIPRRGSHASSRNRLSPLRYHPFSPADYAPAPIYESDLADQHLRDPFADPMDTSYNPGSSVMDSSNNVRHAPF